MRQVYFFITGSAGKRINSQGSDSYEYGIGLVRRNRFFVMIMIVVMLMLSSLEVMAETYYSQSSASVNVTGNWGTVAGGGGSAPANFNGTNTWIIQAGHNMTMSGNWIVGTGGTATVIIEGGLTVSSAYYVTITGTLTVNGILTNAGTYNAASSVTASGSITMNGTYVHARNGGILPTATWAVTSNCNITGITTTAPTIPSATQPFGNFTWNCPSQDPDNDIYLNGQLTSVGGDLHIISTNGINSGLLLGDNPGDLTVNGDYIQTGGRFHLSYSTARNMTVNGDFHFETGVFYINDYSGIGTLNVHGDFFCNGGYFNFLNYVDVPGTLNVTGNCSITGGEFRMSKSSGVGTLNVAGNFSHTGGLIYEDSTGSGSIVFNGTGIQIYTSGGVVNNTINFTVNSGSYLQMVAEETVVSGRGTFTLLPGGTLGIRSANGITEPGTSSGNIQTTGRVFSTGANYIYNGTDAQATGTGLIQNTPANLTINNNAGVTLSSATTISGLLTMENGTLNMAGYNLIAGSLTGSSDITGISGSLTLSIGADNTSPAAYSGVISNGGATTIEVTKTGTGTLILSGTNVYTGVTTISDGVLQLGSATSIDNNSNLVFNGGTLSTGSADGYSETVGILDLEGSSIIALGTGDHTLTFSASNAETWGSGARLTITGWSGTAGSGGTAGKIMVGSDANGLTADQLAQITFYGYGDGAGILSTGEIIPLTSSQIEISSSNPAVVEGNIQQNTINNVVYKFSTTVTAANAVISGLQITTSGTYSATDLSSLKAWYSIDPTFSSSSAVLLSTKTTSLGTGTHVFPDWINQEISVGTPGYIFITADIPCSATVDANIYVAAVTTSDVSFVAGSKSGTTYAGGLQTIQNAYPENVSTPSASVADTQSLLNWTNPPCFDEIMIVAMAGGAVSSIPSGDGSAYTANLAFGSGTPFDGGYVVYKGSASPQTVTNLTNGTTYYYTFFTRKDLIWSSGITVNALARPLTDADLDYRSVGSGNWNDLLTWETYDGTSWGTPLSAPDSDNDQITIRSGHTITVASDVIVDQLTIEPGGQVTVSSGVNLTVADGPDVDFIVSGTLYNSGTITTTGVLHFNSGSIYEHAQNGGTIPVATWDVDSDCNITGITTTAPTIPSATQPFGNFTWNCPSQVTGSDISLNGQLTSVGGDLHMMSTNGTNGGLVLGDIDGDLTVNGDYIQTGGRFHLAYSTEKSMTVNGDFYFQAGVFYITANSGAGTLDVIGDFFVSGGYFNFINYVNDVPGTLNITGNCSITGGEFRMSKSSGVGTLSVAGNFTHTGGLIYEDATGSGSIVFNGTGTQIYNSGGVVTNTINFTVNSGSYLQMATEVTLVNGGGTFTLSPGGTLGIKSASGIAEAGTSSGNIQTTGRVFSTGANYVYNKTGDQETGSGLPTGAITGDVTVAAGTSLTTTNAIIEEGTLTVNGTLIPGTADQVISGTGTLTGTGTVHVNRTAATADFLSQYTISGKILDGLTIDYAEASGGQIVSPLTYWNLVMSNSSGTNTSGGNVIVGGTLTTAPGGTWDIGTNQLTAGNLVNNGSISINSTALDVNGSMIVTGEITQGVGSTVTYNRLMPGTLYRYISSPVSSASLPSGQTYWRWDEPTGNWIETTSCTSGLGYTILTSGNTVSFTGSLVNSASQTGTAPYTTPYTPDRANWGGGGWNLLGNPFTSALDGSLFISTNGTSMDPSYQAIYIYNGADFYYIAEATPGYPGLGVFSGTDVQAGQGFFALAHHDGVSFSFTSGMRKHNTSAVMTKSASTEEAWPGLQLKVKYGEKENSALIVYNANMTAGLDPGYDIGLLSSGSDVEIYTALAEKDNDVNFARQALPLIDYDKNIIPVGIDFEKGGEVTFSAYTVPIEDMRFWLEDRVTGIFTNLNTNTYTINLPEKTYGTGRFFIIASTNTPAGIEKAQSDDTGVRVWTSNEKVIIKGEVSDKAICEIYDLRGKKIVETQLKDEELNTVSLPSGLHGVYLVRVVDGVKVTTHKVALL